jgi:hypothetical protein
MNINLCLTKNYENDSPAYPAKTKPILPAVGVAGLPCLPAPACRRQGSRRRLRIQSILKTVLSEESCCRCKACVRTRPQVYCSTSRTGCVARNVADAQEGRSKIPLYPYIWHNPTAPSRPPIHKLPVFPSSPILTSQLSHFQPILHTYSSAIPPFFLRFP